VRRPEKSSDAQYLNMPAFNVYFILFRTVLAIGSVPERIVPEQVSFQTPLSAYFETPTPKHKSPVSRFPRGHHPGNETPNDLTRPIWTADPFTLPSFSLSRASHLCCSSKACWHASRMTLRGAGLPVKSSKVSKAPSVTISSPSIICHGACTFLLYALSCATKKVSGGS
jgi:hypothetical protein